MATDFYPPESVLPLRSRLDLTQVELAQEVGVSQPLVAMWESGERTPAGPAAILLRQLEDKSKKKFPKRP